MQKGDVVRALVAYTKEQLDALRIRAANERKDFYNLVASEVLEISYSDVMPWMRDEAKHALFGYLYGVSGVKLGQLLKETAMATDQAGPKLNIRMKGKIVNVRVDQSDGMTHLGLHVEGKDFSLKGGPHHEAVMEVTLKVKSIVAERLLIGQVLHFGVSDHPFE